MSSSELPVEDFFEVFLAGNVARGGGEADVADLAAGLGTEPGGLAEQLGGWNVGQVAFGQLLLDATEVTADLLQRCCRLAKHFSARASVSIARRFWMSN
jgi:hypothetical protein